jgi:hypothetical protein
MGAMKMAATVEAMVVPMASAAAHWAGATVLQPKSFLTLQPCSLSVERSLRAGRSLWTE